jgi:hypothetical protein
MEEAMSLNVYEDSKVCDARGVLKMDVEACSKAILALCAGHGKSPCFLRCCVLRVICTDWQVLVFSARALIPNPTHWY